MLTGLTTRHRKDLEGATDEQLALLGGTVLHLEWKDIQPQSDVYRFPDPPDMPFSLRILGGTQAPQWVKDDVGSFPYVEPQSGKTYSCVKWWDVRYEYRWRNLHLALRAFYGSNPNLVEVSQGGCGTRYQETFIRGISNLSNRLQLEQCGVTRDVDANAIVRVSRVVRDVWPDMWLSQSFFPHQYQNAGKATVDVDSTVRVIDGNRDLFDAVGPHDWRAPLDMFRSTYYQAMLGLNMPVYAQIAQPSNVGDWYTATANAINAGAYRVEVSRDWKEWPIDKLAELAGMFPTPQRFIDVPEGHLFHDDIEWLAEQGITKGCNPPDNTMFCPDEPVTRAQMAAFLHRALKDLLR